MNHSTLFECGFDLYFVEFDIDGASLHNVKLYKVKLRHNNNQMAMNMLGHNRLEMSTSLFTGFEAVFHIDPHVEKLFREKYTPKAVKDRVS